MIREIGSSEFVPLVLSADGEVMVEFFATWCPHCQRMMPIMHELDDIDNVNIPIYQVDVDKNPDLANTYAPDGFPTFCIFESGELVKRATGEQTLQALENIIDIG